jgi:transcriptional regulator with XRE-family HTH domain
MSDPWSAEKVLLRGEIRAIREVAGLTQLELSTSLGKPQSYVSKIESGDRSVSLLEVRALCMGCGFSFIDFVQALDRKLISLTYRRNFTRR